MGTPKTFYNLYSPGVPPQTSAMECKELGIKVRKLVVFVTYFIKVASLMATLGEYPIVRYNSESNISMTVAQHVKANLDDVLIFPTPL